MARGADARTFAFITGADRTRAADIREMARATANADTLSDFLKAYRERYPAYSAAMRKPQAPAADKLPSPAEGAAAEPAAPPSRS
jgi:hypothetical protein